MRHFPIFLRVDTARIVVSGAGETALAKLRLLLKTGARIAVYGADPHADISDLARQGRIALHQRALAPGDITGAALLYAGNDDPREDARVAAIGRAAGVLVNVVDNLDASDFITPAIVDRDPVTVAIGTEGTAPVLARRIKADIEAMLPASLGLLARIAERFRPLAERLPMGRLRREFWSRFFFSVGPRKLAEGGARAAEAALPALLEQFRGAHGEPGRVTLVGTGPGDPELLTLKARKLIDAADVVLHDKLVPREILELARREATVIETGKKGFGEAMGQGTINDLMIEHARAGAHVVRLKSGDPGVFGRLDEEIEALDAAAIDWGIIPGVTSACASAAAIGGR